MDLDQIRHILDLVREHELSEFELEQDGLRLKVRKGVAQAAPAAASAPQQVQAVAAPAAVAAAPLPAQLDRRGEDAGLAVVKSPIVGTFYRSPEPGAPTFVELGTPVKKGQVLCIIEAMKLMNEIDCEFDGAIAKIYVENGAAVQYGDPLFGVKTS